MASWSVVVLDRCARASGSGRWVPPLLQKLAESVRREAGVPDNAAHCDRVHGVVPWDGQNPRSVCHDDVLALPGNAEPSPFECPNGPKVRDAGYLRHALRLDLHFPQILFTGELFSDVEVFTDCVLNVR